MGANERRLEIMRILTARRQDTIGNLARELGVCERTVRRDVETLTVDYPLETRQGNGGCVMVAEWYYPHKNLLSQEQQQVLTDMLPLGDEHQARVIRQLLSAYGSISHQKMSRRAY